MASDGIAFFDSGIGGLTVLNECIKRLPSEVFYYYGDNAHAPYGNLPTKQIRRYVLSAFARLEKCEVKAAVIACNTATAVCAEELRNKYPFPIIGAEPAVLPAAKDGGEIYILCTRATYNSQRLRDLCARAESIYPYSHLRPIACDALAGAIEENITQRDFRFEMILPKGAPSAVVLGCTHYIYIKERIEKFYGCKAYDGNAGMANRLCNLLENQAFSQNLEKNRDERPPTVHKEDFNGKTGVKFEKITNTNERSGKWRLQNAGIPLNVRGARIYFLGKNRKKNREIFKQMFVF